MVFVNVYGVSACVLCAYDVCECVLMCMRMRMCMVFVDVYGEHACVSLCMVNVCTHVYGACVWCRKKADE